MEAVDKEFERRLSRLESLVEDLLKDNPPEDSIQKKMASLKIQYTTDPVERINRVLTALHKAEFIDSEEM